MTNEVYINKIAKFLPNNPISNEEMEEYLGLIGDNPSKSKRIVLRNNGIKNRYYAITKNGTPTHTNAEMAALAVKNLFSDNVDELKKVELLCCGTSAPDQMMPSHAVMVHGWLPESSAMEVISPAGNCCSGMHALKYAWMSIKLGAVANAVTSGSERLSRILRSDVFEEESHKLQEAEKNPYITFEKEFLRWMLSDGAGAMHLTNKKNTDGLSLRVDFIDAISFAHEVEACMYMACEKLEDGTLRSYMDYSAADIIDHSILSMKQDVKLLSEYVVPLGIDKMKEVFENHGLKAADINYFLPHISSEFFRSKIDERMAMNGIAIPQDRWFTNLSSVGNVGAGSIYLMLEELFNSNRLKVGDKIFMIIPESARFSYVYGLLTVC